MYYYLDHNKPLKHKSNIYKIGMNILINRFYALNGLIELNELDLTLPSFKKKMKVLFAGI